MSSHFFLNVQTKNAVLLHKINCTFSGFNANVVASENCYIY